MFVWSMLLGLVIIYSTFTRSVKDRYFYIIQPILSTILLGLAIYFVYKRLFIFNSLSLFTLAAIIISSIVFGILFQLHARITLYKNKKIILLPGRYINFIPLFLLLAVSYYIAYLKLTNRDFFGQVSDERQLLLIAFTSVTSLWIVMNLYVCYKYFTHKSTELKNKNLC